MAGKLSGSRRRSHTQSRAKTRRILNRPGGKILCSGWAWGDIVDTNNPLVQVLELGTRAGLSICHKAHRRL